MTLGPGSPPDPNIYYRTYNMCKGRELPQKSKGDVPLLFYAPAPIISSGSFSERASAIF